MLPVGINVRVLNALVSYLRTDKIWAERHAYSIRIMYENRLTASLHLYPGYGLAVLRLYGDSEANEYVLSRVSMAVESFLPGFRLEIHVIKR